LLRINLNEEPDPGGINRRLLTGTTRYLSLYRRYVPHSRTSPVIFQSALATTIEEAP
jgi:hypothetical protein